MMNNPNGEPDFWVVEVEEPGDRWFNHWAFLTKEAAEEFLASTDDFNPVDGWIVGRMWGEEFQ